MRILPERTVDAWAAWYLLLRFPTANLWAPSQNDDFRWDFGFESLPGKGFVLENKGVLDRPRSVRLSLRQLAWYVQEVALRLCTAVYYVLPTLPQTYSRSGSSSSGVVPAIAAARLRMPFEKTTFVVDLEDLIPYVASRSPRHHARQLASALRRNDWRIVSPHFLYTMSQSEIGRVPSATTLERFADALTECDPLVGFHYFARGPDRPIPR